MYKTTETEQARVLYARFGVPLYKSGVVTNAADIGNFSKAETMIVRLAKQFKLEKYFVLGSKPSARSLSRNEGLYFVTQAYS